ncbi:alkaline phosphatase family protein [Paenarthrobacter sp. 4246]|uniref:alkaline phosphatase family protein n=1 Tax=Paenarthrobacter sp. 4246 TaxID=3156456 RepID=UPI0033950AAA
MKNEPYVLVVGIDGVRYDSLMSADTPALDQIARSGFLLPVRVHGKNATISGPVWATVATGVYADRHKVTGNSDHPPELAAFQDFTAVLRAARPESRTMIAASWFPVAAPTGCGPLFSSRGWVPEEDPEEANDAGSWVSADDAVADYAAARLEHEDLAASFVYFGEADVEAHNNGTGIAYISAIQRCDSRVKSLLEAIESRPRRGDEHWTVIVVTDHGHVAAGGHGGETEAERTAWIAACGANVPRDVFAVDHADIFPQVLATFGVAAGDTDGLTFGSRRGPQEQPATTAAPR